VRDDPPTEIAGDRFPLVDMELGPLIVELGLSDVGSVCQSGEVGEALAQDGRGERGHNPSSVSVGVTTVEP